MRQLSLIPRSEQQMVVEGPGATVQSDPAGASKYASNNDGSSNNLENDLSSYDGRTKSSQEAQRRTRDLMCCVAATCAMVAAPSGSTKMLFTNSSMSEELFLSAMS